PSPSSVVSSVRRSLRRAREIATVRRPRHAMHALRGLSPRSRGVAARGMVAASWVATPRSRRTGTAALVEAVGRSGMAQRERAEAILERVALAPDTDARTRVDIGMLHLERQDFVG